MFEYRLRKSARARHVRLRVSSEYGLEVVVPEGFAVAYIPRLLAEREHWIRAALERMQGDRADTAWCVPDRIALPAMAKLWQVQVQTTAAASVTVRAIGADGLQLRGCVDNEQKCRAALGRWLVREARDYLEPRLHALSRQTGLRYRRVCIKRQKTRWGSCSRDKTISLNAKLLFLPPPVVDYVLVHELCHLAEMNHSTRFWALVEKHCPDYRPRRALLKDVSDRIPRWCPT
ncbi:MAG: M48 family metallopeptidase [Gammaproteobacteria bacterium]|nr:M48 family metallopeptidase [Gammaproteobacteria bacterium]